MLKVFDLYLEFESNRSIVQFMEEVHKEDYKLRNMEGLKYVEEL